MHGRRLSRRDFLALTAATVSGFPGPLAAGTGDRGRRRRRRRRGQRRQQPPALPRVNGAINIQPVRRFGPDQEPRDVEIIPRIVDLQMRALYELGFESIRLTLGFANQGLDLLAAIPYVRAARALGIDVLGLIGQFGYFHDLANELVDAARRELVLDAYLELYAPPVVAASPAVERPGRVTFQVLNEPTSFLGIRPSDYVTRFLAPSYEHLKRRAPDISIVSAAPVGEKIGVARFLEMLAAGVEDHCDIVGLHVYDRELIRELEGLTARPIWITETGAVGPENHRPWVEEVYPALRAALPNLEQIFFFELYDLQPRAFRLLDIAEREDGSITAEVESTALHDELARRVEMAAGKDERARYEDLVPDITAYFPTDEDIERILEIVSKRGGR